MAVNFTRRVPDIRDDIDAAPAPTVARDRSQCRKKGSFVLNGKLFGGRKSKARAQNPDASGNRSPTLSMASEAVPSLKSNATSSVDLRDGVAAVSAHSPQSRPMDGNLLPGIRFDSDSADSDSDDSDHYTESLASRSGATDHTSISTQPALQTRNLALEYDPLQPVPEDDPASYDLVSPYRKPDAPSFSLEAHCEQMFSQGHLQAIFNDPALLARFTSFLSTYRKESLPLLVFYLDALKASRAIKYANAVAESLDPIKGHDFSAQFPPPTANTALENKASAAFEKIAREDLPAFITRTFISVVSATIRRRITGTLPPHLRETSEGLAEVFCLSDPSRPDNPIVFASEEFHRTTQYGVSHALGRNCRFLQGPRTNKDSVRRIREAIAAGRDHSEVFVNYRRDGSSFLNLLMCAPLRDSRGNLRYFIGAQVDVSGLAKEAVNLEGFQRYLANLNDDSKDKNNKDELQALAEMFNHAELDTVRRFGGRMHRPNVEGAEESEKPGLQRPRLLLNDPSDPEQDTSEQQDLAAATKELHGKLTGVYSHYLLVRPYPSLRILFTSPSLRVPGMLQSPLLDRVGSSDRVRNELLAAFAEGRGVTAKVRWVTRNDIEGRNRWLHCTPLLGSNGNIGVWMVVLVDDEDARMKRRFKPAPPVDADILSRQGHRGLQRFDDYAGRPSSRRGNTSNKLDATYADEVSFD